MAKVKQTKSGRGGKMKFYEVKAPLTAASIHLYGVSPEELEGRIVKIDMTKSLRGKGMELKLKVRAEGDELKGEPVSTEIVRSYIRKVMRRGVDYVEDSFEAECRDLMIRIKIFIITRRRVSRAVRKALGESARKYLEGYLKTRDAQDIFSEILSNKIQKQLALKLKKIYPLALCEIRVFKIVGEKGKE